MGVCLVGASALRYHDRMDARIVLPPQTLFPTAFDDQDPMAELAKELLGGHNHMSPARARALLAFGQRVPFDPNALVVDTYARPLMAFVLERMPYYTEGTNHDWPDAAEGFADLSVKQWDGPQAQAASGEWVAAALMAAGADPWRAGQRTQERSSPVQWGYPHSSAPVFHALRCGMAGLVALMMKKPGAPSVDELFHSPVSPKFEQVRQAAWDSWLHAACAEPKMIHVLNWALDQGVRPNPSSTRHVLEFAHPGALDAFASRGLLPTDKALVRRLESAWRSRAKAEDLSSQKMVAMSAKLKGESVSSEDLLASDFMVLLTKNPWGKQSFLANPCNLGVEFLASRARVPTGALAGNWSGLGAQLVHRLRQSSDRGSGAADFYLEEMIGRKGLESISSPSPLAPSIGFDWREDVAIDGFVALMMLGRSNPTRSDQDWRELLKKEGALLGIGEVLEWANAHVDDAISFTEAMIFRGAESAAGTLTQVWRKALEVNPDYLGGSMERRLRLMGALHSHFSLKERGRVNRLVSALTPWTAAVSNGVPDFSTLDSQELSLALETALVTRDSAWLEKLPECFDRFSDRDLDRIQVWLKALDKEARADPSIRDDARVGVIESCLKQKVFDSSLKPAAPQKPRPRI